MKIYLFNPESGVYLGEDFADEALMKQRGYVLPRDATSMAPPEGGRGDILVFDAVAQRWELRSHRNKETFRHSCREGKSSYQKTRVNPSMKFVLLALSTWFLGVVSTGTCFLLLAAYVS
jgi:hypothetical protein